MPRRQNMTCDSETPLECKPLVTLISIAATRLHGAASPQPEA